MPSRQGVLYNWTCYSGVLALTLQLAGTSAGGAGATQRGHQRPAARATAPEHVDCSAVSPDLPGGEDLVVPSGGIASRKCYINLLPEYAV